MKAAGRRARQNTINPSRFGLKIVMGAAALSSILEEIGQQLNPPCFM
jgi:hypothetical protein